MFGAEYGLQCFCILHRNALTFVRCAGLGHAGAAVWFGRFVAQLISYLWPDLYMSCLI